MLRGESSPILRDVPADRSRSCFTLAGEICLLLRQLHRPVAGVGNSTERELSGLLFILTFSQLQVD